MPSIKEDKPDFDPKNFCHQKYHKLFFWASAILGYYPPGFYHLTSNKRLQKVLHVLGFLPFGLHFVRAFFVIFSLIYYNPEYASRLQELRSLIISATFFVRFCPQAVRHKEFSELFDRWNSCMSYKPHSKRRMEIYKEKMKIAYMIFKLDYLLVGVPLTLLVVVSIYAPYTAASAHAWSLHNLESSIHIPLVILQCYVYISSSMKCFSIAVTTQLIQILSTEMTFLTESLGEIVLNSTDYDTRTLREKKFKEWIKAYSFYDKWIRDVTDYMHFESIFLCVNVGLYGALMSFTLLVLVIERNYLNMVILMIFFMGVCTMRYKEVANIHYLTEQCENVCSLTYGGNMIDNNKEFLKMWLMVKDYSSKRLPRFRYLKIFKIDLPAYFQMLSAAYNIFCFSAGNLNSRPSDNM